PGLQGQLALASPAVTAEGTALLDHAVAGNEYRHRIGTHGRADGACCPWCATGCGELAVGNRPAGRNVEQGTPDGQLEVGAAYMEVQWRRISRGCGKDALRQREGTGFVHFQRGTGPVACQRRVCCSGS